MRIIPKTHLYPVFRGLVCLLVAAALLALSGCGKGRIPTYVVTGAVMVDDRPAEGAMVIFCPVDSSNNEVANLRPFGVTGPGGKFTLITFDPGDGAPAGEYKVLVKWPAQTSEDERDAGPPGAVRNGPDRLKNKYYNLETSPLKATVKKQSNELTPFNLKSK